MAAAQLSPGPAPLRAPRPAGPGQPPQRVLLPRTRSPALCGAQNSHPYCHRAQSVPPNFSILFYPPSGQSPRDYYLNHFTFFFFSPIIISCLFLISRFKSLTLECVILVISLFSRPWTGPEQPSSALPTAHKLSQREVAVGTGRGGPGPALGGLGRVPAARQIRISILLLEGAFITNALGYTERNLCPV